MMKQPFSRSGPAGRAVAIAILAVAGAAVHVSCSATNDDNHASGGGGSQQSSTTQTGTGQGGDEPILTSSGTGSACGVQCSADLHSVLDCNGVVVKTCPADQGCGPGGTCVPSCDSAVSNGGTIGCEFYSVVPAPEYETQGSCFAALLANTWGTPITLTAAYGDQTLDIGTIARTPVGTGQNITYEPLTNGQLAPGQIAILFLANWNSNQIFYVDCPAGVTAGVNMDASIDKTGLGQAFHITTTAPVVAYDMYPYGGAASLVSSATLLLPTASWGKNYIAADGYRYDPSLSFVNGGPFVQIVAAEDDTKVTISPTAAILDGPGVVGTAQGQPQTYTLGHGQVLQFLQYDELSGSPISSDKPISVWGGSSCMNIPTGSGACDSAHQQLLPVSALGNEYLAVRYRDRVDGLMESVPWRIVGAVDGTKLTYEPAPPPNAPLTIEGGQTLEFSTSEPFVVRSQDIEHPFYVSGHMTGGVPIPDTQGDPEYVSVIPPQQHLRQYLFLTDPTYRNTHLVFTRTKASDGTFKDVLLECLGPVTGWQPLGSSGQHEYARVDLVRDGAPQGKCDNGVHQAKSDAPFGLTVWGWDVTVSYAFPAGMSLQPINTVVVPPIAK